MVDDPRTVSAAFEAGINFFFLTADLHWPAYEASRRGLAQLLSRPGVRDDIVVAVASYATQPAFCHAPFREVLEALPALGRIDLTVIGGTYHYDFKTRLVEYRRHREGVAFPPTKAVGASFHDRRVAARAIAAGQVDIAYCRYNSVRPAAELDLFPFVSTRRATLLYNFRSTDGYLRPAGMRALGLSTRHWRPTPTDHYRFVLGRPQIDGLLCSPSTPHEIHELVQAMESGPLTAEEYCYIRDLGDLLAGRAVLDEASRR